MRIHLEDVDDEDPYDPDRYWYRGAPYTGDVYATNASGAVIEEFSVRNGVVHGVERSWYGDGTPKTEVRVDRGRAIGTARYWHPNGRPAEERDFDDRGRIVARRRWTDDGTPLPDD